MAGIYVHVPFCRSKCAYCDFYSVAGDGFKDAYVDALIREWHMRKAELGGEPVRTVYFGGGTPSTLSDVQLGSIAGLFPKDCVEEFTIEVNPEDVSNSRVAAWRDMGINRVSMGVQSLVDAELKAIGRRHSPHDAVKAVETLVAGGIGNISCDLIYGLPGQTLDSWRYSLRHMFELPLKHLSAYCLSYEEGTRLTGMLRRGEIEEASDELTEAMYDELCRQAREYGFEHYEISNFAVPGFRSRHNSSYWDGTPYLGLGPGAHSLGADGIRRYVPAGMGKYTAQPVAAVDEESDIDRLNDLIFVSLRTAEGLPVVKFSENQRRLLMAAAAPALAAGHLKECAGRLIIPEKYWLISDSIIRELLFSDD